MTEINKLCFSYGKRKILNGLSFTAECGECVIFAGANGSGKSTALSLIAGVLRPDSGTVYTDGTIGYAPQGTALFEDMTARDNLRFFAGLAHCKLPDELPFGVQDYLDMRVSKMSGGMKRQLSIACALLGEPQLILLDEPCSGLDIEYRDELSDLICKLKSQGKTVIYAGHEPMDFFSFCDKLIFFGDMCQYTRAELSGEPEDKITFCKHFSEILKNIKQRGKQYA